MRHKEALWIKLKKKSRHVCQTAKVKTLLLPHASYITLGKILNFSGSNFFPSKMRGNNMSLL